MNKPLTEYLVENADNLNYEEICKKFDVSIPTIYRYMKMCNIKKKKGDDIRLEQIKQMRNEGKTYEEIGAKFNVSRQRIEQIFHGYN